MSAMPLPPEQYIKMYSDEHVAMGITPPPPPPINKDNYSMFGQPFSADDTIIQSLESQGIRRLYPATKDVDRKKELHKLNHSILVNFLDLIDLLIKAPESTKRDEKIDDINLLFIHMHHLINEFRPHQARETLRVMLHVQKRKRLQVADKFQANLDKVCIFSPYYTCISYLITLYVFISRILLDITFTFQVQETIENALQSLPEQDDASGSGLASLDVPEAMDTTGMYRDAEKDNCSPIDRIMCGLADEIETETTPS